MIENNVHKLEYYTTHNANAILMMYVRELYYQNKMANINHRSNKSIVDCVDKFYKKHNIQLWVYMSNIYYFNIEDNPTMIDIYKQVGVNKVDLSLYYNDYLDYKNKYKLSRVMYMTFIAKVLDLTVDQVCYSYGLSRNTVQCRIKKLNKYLKEFYENNVKR